MTNTDPEGYNLKSNTERPYLLENGKPLKWWICGSEKQNSISLVYYSV
jgi:hypothetical protein